MNCRKVNHLLSAYMDGELPGVEHRQIHEHLARCPECAEEYAGLLRMKRLLAGMRVREPRTDLATRIVEQVHRSQETPRIGPIVRWTEQVGVWWKAAAPSPPALALGAGLAIIGVIGVSHIVENREPIHWNPVTASVLANQPLAPESPLAPQDSDPVHLEGSVSNVSNVDIGTPQRGWQRNNAFAPQSGDFQSQMYSVGMPLR